VTPAVVYVSMGLEQSIEKGEKLVVFRGEGDITDPVTGQKLGSELARIASLEVVEVHEKHCEGKRVDELKAELRVGDVVRSARSDVLIGVLPLASLKGQDTGLGRKLAEQFLTALVNRRVRTVERARMAKVLSELNLQQSQLSDPATAQRIGKQIGAFAIVSGTITPKKGVSEVFVRLIKVETGEIRLAFSHTIGEADDGQALPPEPLPIEHQPSSIRTNPIDGAQMVWIPPGQFAMGSEKGRDDEKPVHVQRVEGIWMYAKEVTNAQFQRFLKSNPQWQKDRVDKKFHNGDYLKDWKVNNYPDGKADHPVVWVPWHAAKTYAEWAGGRLPTEAEWEYAARAGKQFEYGTVTGGIGKDLANYGGDGTKPNGTKTVGSYRPNPFGLCDMAGNVWEWCSSLHKPYPYSGKDGREDSTAGGKRVARGGSWSYHEAGCRTAIRGSGDPSGCNSHDGFRVVISEKGR